MSRAGGFCPFILPFTSCVHISFCPRSALTDRLPSGKDRVWDGVPGSALKLPRFIHLGLTDERRTIQSAAHHTSRSKRWGAPRCCPNYAAVKLLTKTWWIIPFTLKNIHSRFQLISFKSSFSQAL